MSTNTKDIAGQSVQPVKLQPLRTPTTSASFLKVKVILICSTLIVGVFQVMKGFFTPYVFTHERIPVCMRDKKPENHGAQPHMGSHSCLVSIRTAVF